MTSISLSTPIRTPPAADPQALPAAQPASAESKVRTDATRYFSPVVRIDPETALAIWQVRNPDTGAIEQQFPADVTVKAYQSHMQDATQPEPPSQDATLPAPAASLDLPQDVTAPSPASTGPDLKDPGAPLPKEAPAPPIKA